MKYVIYSQSSRLFWASPYGWNTSTKAKPFPSKEAAQDLMMKAVSSAMRQHCQILTQTEALIIEIMES